MESDFIRSIVFHDLDIDRVRDFVGATYPQFGFTEVRNVHGRFVVIGWVHKDSGNAEYVPGEPLQLPEMENCCG